MTRLVLISLLAIYFLVSTNCHGQGKWSMGFDMASRSEWRKYEDSYRYLFKGGGPHFPLVEVSPINTANAGTSSRV